MTYHCYVERTFLMSIVCSSPFLMSIVRSTYHGYVHRMCLCASHVFELTFSVLVVVLDKITKIKKKLSPKNHKISLKKTGRSSTNVPKSMSFGSATYVLMFSPKPRQKHGRFFTVSPFLPVPSRSFPFFER